MLFESTLYLDRPGRAPRTRMGEHDSYRAELREIGWRTWHNLNCPPRQGTHSDLVRLRELNVEAPTLALRCLAGRLLYSLKHKH